MKLKKIRLEHLIEKGKYYLLKTSQEPIMNFQGKNLAEIPIRQVDYIGALNYLMSCRAMGMEDEDISECIFKEMPTKDSKEKAFQALANLYKEENESEGIQITEKKEEDDGEYAYSKT
jgi:hypothetical protein